MDGMDQILILMTTYNGERYIGEMIDSIVAQEHTNWKLIVSDDGSTDRTLEIVDQYVAQFPEKIVHYSSGQRFGNPQYHFMHLLTNFHNAPYIMFSDQDDVWHRDKLSKTYAMMKKVEKDTTVPAMVHTDLKVVDAQLNELHPSFHQLTKLDGGCLSLNHILIQNPVAGCTMMFNQALAELATQVIPDQYIIMHDWWLTLLASACGTTGYLCEATIDYRQHGNNSVGASNAHSLSYILRRIREQNVEESLYPTFKQADILLSSFSDKMADESRHMVEVYANLNGRNGIARRMAYIRYGFWKHGLSRRVAQLVFG